MSRSVLRALTKYAMAFEDANLSSVDQFQGLKMRQDSHVVSLRWRFCFVGHPHGVKLRSWKLEKTEA